MSPKETPLCLKLLKKDDNWQLKAKKVLQIIKACYCVSMFFNRDSIP